MTEGDSELPPRPVSNSEMLPCHKLDGTDREMTRDWSGNFRAVILWRCRRHLQAQFQQQLLQAGSQV